MALATLWKLLQSWRTDPALMAMIVLSFMAWLTTGTTTTPVAIPHNHPFAHQLAQANGTLTKQHWVGPSLSQLTLCPMG